MEDKHGVGYDPIGYSRYTLQHLDTIVEAASGVWPTQLLQTFFDVRAHVALHYVSAKLRERDDDASSSAMRTGTPEEAETN